MRIVSFHSLTPPVLGEPGRCHCAVPPGDKRRCPRQERGMTQTIPDPARDLPGWNDTNNSRSSAGPASTQMNGQLRASSLNLSRTGALRRVAAVFLIQSPSPQAGFVVLLDFSFASQGRISSNELDNFPTSSGARRQLSSSGLPLATRAGKAELPHQRMISTLRSSGQGT